jgi:hypothetical protein
MLGILSYHLLPEGVHAHALHQACMDNNNGRFVCKVCTGYGRHTQVWQLVIALDIDLHYVFSPHLIKVIRHIELKRLEYS